MDIAALDKSYVAATYKRMPIVPKKGKGCLLTDYDGKVYIDMTGGIGVNCLGWCDRQWQKAVFRQTRTLGHVSNLDCCQPAAALAALLCQRTGMEKAFFCNSGAEANECAIKAARKYAAETKGSEYDTILTLTGSFHGRTITTLSATGQDCFHTLYHPLTEGFVHVPPNDAPALQQAVDTVPLAGIMLETIQGEGGVLPLSTDYLRFAARLAGERDIPLIIDEVQTGNGRTGELYSYMHHGIRPDIVTTAKGLGGGLPIGAVLFSHKLKNVFAPGEHGSTFGGNPICCAAALHVIRRLDSPFLQQVQEKGAYLQSRLQNTPGILQITGTGLMLGLQTELPAQQVVERARQRGILLMTAKDRIRLLPPLNIPWRYLRKAADGIRQSCGNSQITVHGADKGK